MAILLNLKMNLFDGKQLQNDKLNMNRKSKSTTETLKKGVKYVQSEQ